MSRPGYSLLPVPDDTQAEVYPGTSRQRTKHRPTKKRLIAVSLVTFSMLAVAIVAIIQMMPPRPSQPQEVAAAGTPDPGLDGGEPPAPTIPEVPPKPQQEGAAANTKDSNLGDGEPPAPTIPEVPPKPQQEGAAANTKDSNLVDVVTLEPGALGLPNTPSVNSSNDNTHDENEGLTKKQLDEGRKARLQEFQTAMVPSDGEGDVEERFIEALTEFVDSFVDSVEKPTEELLLEKAIAAIESVKLWREKILPEMQLLLWEDSIWDMDAWNVLYRQHKDDLATPCQPSPELDPKAYKDYLKDYLNERHAQGYKPIGWLLPGGSPRNLKGKGSSNSQRRFLLV